MSTIAFTVCAREPAAIIAITSAIAAYGALFTSKAYGTSINLTGGPQGALIALMVFYAVCVVVTCVLLHKKTQQCPAYRPLTRK